MSLITRNGAWIRCKYTFWSCSLSCLVSGWLISRFFINLRFIYYCGQPTIGGQMVTSMLSPVSTHSVENRASTHDESLVEVPMWGVPMVRVVRSLDEGKHAPKDITTVSTIICCYFTSPPSLDLAASDHGLSMDTCYMLQPPFWMVQIANLFRN
jgi:hypothetical protein